MDLELQMEQLSCFEMVGAFTETVEEVMETAIPEYCPDIARIIDALGEFNIREKVMGSDVFTVTGTVKVTVLYTSEEVSGLRSISVSVPCSCKWNDVQLLQCDHICVSGRVMLVEAKALNTRKLYLKVISELTACGYQSVDRDICKDVESEPTLRVKKEDMRLDILRIIEDRQFSFSQDAMLPNGEQPEDILLCKLSPRINSLQKIGNKLSLRGEMLVRILYRDAKKILRCYETSLTISEILEGNSIPDDTILNAYCTLSDYDCRLLRTENAGGFGISAGIRVCIYAFGQYRGEYLSDLYSTKNAVTVDRKYTPYPEAKPFSSIQMEATVPLEFGNVDPFIFVSGTDCSAVACLQKENSTVLRTTLHLKLLYLDEEGAAVVTERTVDVETTAMEEFSGATAQCMSVLPTCFGSTVELQCVVSFLLKKTGKKEIMMPQSVMMSEQEQKKLPSIVLRRMMAGEELWDIAKQYQTDEQVIVDANPNGIHSGYLLLIPKAR